LTLVVLLVLAALWAVVLLPPLLRSRRVRSVSADSIGEFNHKLGVLRRTNGAAPPAVPAPVRTIARRESRPNPPAPVAIAVAPVPAGSAPRRASSVSTRAAKRRGDVLRVLVVAVAITMALAYFTGSPLLWAVQIAADVCLLAFLGLWAWARNMQADRVRTVRYMTPRRAPELALRRTGSS
jgi:membrane protein YdbS with pleckstrin-like domain